MKILMIGPREIYPEPKAGLDAYVRGLAEHLAAEGEIVTVCCHKMKTWQNVEIPKHISIKEFWTLKQHHLDTFFCGFFATLAALFHRNTVIHYHGGAALFSWLPRLFRKRVVVTIHSRESKAEHIPAPLRLFYRLAEKTGIQNAHRVSAVSQTLQRELTEQYEKEIAYIPIGIEPFFCDSARELNPLGLTLKKYLLFLGRVAPGKGIELLLKAKTPYPIVIAGEPLYDKRYLAALKRQAPKEIIFLGHVTGRLKKELLAHALLYVQASENEGASIALLEAMSCGLPLLVSDIAQNRGIVGDAGIFFRTKDASDFQEKLEALLADPETLKKLGEKSRDNIVKNFAWDREKLTAFFANK